MTDFAMTDEEEAIAAAVVSELSFPVVLFDGKQEINVGRIVLLPSMNFKAFQSIISDTIGLSPHQFSVHIADRHRSHGFRIAVTERTNFSAILRNRGYFFLVLLKRSRRERRRRSPAAIQKTPDSHHHHRFDPPGNVMLLRRDGSGVSVDGYGSPSELNLGRAGYERRVRELQVEKERYLMNMGLVSGQGLDSLSLDSGERSPTSGGGVVCGECSRGGDPEFHWCVLDPVTVGFRSPAGPIARPSRESG